MEIGKYGVDPDHTEYAGTYDNDEGWDKRFAQASGGCNGSIHKG